MQRAHAHGVIERHHAERALARAVHVLRHMRERGGAFGALSARHTFRPRGRAGGVEHHRPCLGICTRRCIRGASDRSHFRTSSIDDARTGRLAGAPPLRADTSSKTSAFASASAQKKSRSSAVARQLTGVMMMPANWQAQCRVAASQRFCSAVTRWSPGFSPSASRPATTDGDAPVPFAHRSAAHRRRRSRARSDRARRWRRSSVPRSSIAQPFRGIERGRDDRHIAGAAADVAAQKFAQLGFDRDQVT